MTYLEAKIKEFFSSNEKEEENNMILIIELKVDEKQNLDMMLEIIALIEKIKSNQINKVGLLIITVVLLFKKYSVCDLIE